MKKNQTSGPRPFALDQILVGVILTATFLLFSVTLGFDFVCDDRLQILQNPYILSWRFLPHYFTSNVWGFKAGTVSNYYRPLFLVWLRLNEVLFGLQPVGWHLTSVLMHVFVTLEVYWVGLVLFPERRVAVIASAIFGLHPIHTESVAWVSAVTDPLMTALMLASLLGYFRYRAESPGKRIWLAISLLLYALATIAKETVLIFPLVIFAYEWIWGREPGSPHPWRSRIERFRAAFLCALPYVGVTAAYLVARIRALGIFSAVMTDVPAQTMFLTWPSLVWFYEQKLVWPSGLSPFYDTPYVRELGMRSFLFPSVMVALTVCMLWFWATKVGKSEALPEGPQESRVVAFASLWIALPLLPLLNLSALPPGEIAKDRYLYISSIGAAWLVAMGWRHIAGMKGKITRRRASEFVALAACIVLATLSMRQSAYWSNDLLLYTRACAIAPRNPSALGNLAITAYSQGYPLAALKLYKQALDSDPDFERIYYDKAVVELDLGRLEESDSDLCHALQLAPADATALFALGKVRYHEGRLEDSAGLVHRALELYPDGRGYHFTLGSVLEKEGDLKGALHEFSMELNADPSSQDARLGIVRVKKLAATGTVSRPG